MSELRGNLWNAWNKIDDWFEKYWGMYWDDVGQSGEWTDGVITPFIVTELAPALGCKPVRLEQTGQKDRRRADYILLKDEKELVYIEHENSSKDVIEELKKLLPAKVPLKVVVTYDELDMLKGLAKDIQRRVQENKDGSDWLFIGGVFKENEDVKWVAYSISTLDNKATLTELG